jgi:hypothetical protein
MLFPSCANFAPVNLCSGEKMKNNLLELRRELSAIAADMLFHSSDYSRGAKVKRSLTCPEIIRAAATICAQANGAGRDVGTVRDRLAEKLTGFTLQLDGVPVAPHTMAPILDDLALVISSYVGLSKSEASKTRGARK